MWRCGPRARRSGSIRYRPEAGGKPSYPHTLNGSALALPRIWAALLENGYDGGDAIAIPEALHPHTGFTTITKSA